MPLLVTSACLALGATAIGAWSHPLTVELADTVRRERGVDSSSTHLPALWSKEKNEWMFPCISAEAVDNDSLPYYSEWQSSRGIGEGTADDARVS